MNCIIVDDEPIARRGMKRLVETEPRLKLLAMFGSAEDALDYISENDVDLVFMDIQMPGMTGMEMAHELPEKTLLIFTTAYTEYAAESYALDAVDYLVKPIRPERFSQAVRKALEYSDLLDKAGREEPDVRSTPEMIVVKADRCYHRVPLSEILFVEGLKDYVVLNMPDRKLVTRMTVKALQEMLPEHDFLRVNKSYIVNVNNITKFDTKDVFVKTTQIAIGANYRAEVMDRLFK